MKNTASNPRLEANRKILEILGQAVEQNPDCRFHQLLQFLGIETPRTDQFYEESTETLETLSRMTNTV